MGLRGLKSILALSCGVIGWTTLGLPSGSAQAQSLFCPAAVNGQTGFALTGGNCTNNTIGAFSNAALAAQALSDVSQSASLQTTQVALDTISARRRIEMERCPEGFVREEGVCRPIAVTAQPAERPPAVREERKTPVPRETKTTAPVERQTARKPTRKARRETARPAVPAAPVYKAPVRVVETGPRYGAWARGFGDAERRTGSGTTSIVCCTLGPAGGIPNTLALDTTSHATNWGILAGADATFRGISAQNDGITAGLLVGYVSTDVHLTTTSTSSSPGNVGNGAADFRAHLRGPTLGGYVTYFNGPFSADLTTKVDFLSTDVNFADTLAYTANVGINTQTASFAGQGSTRLNNYTTAGNLNYRIPFAGPWWVEPTAGFLYSLASYSSGADQLGLADGHVLRLQGGSRLGVDVYSGGLRITPTVTALLYDDVSVSGGFVTSGVFSTVPSAIQDEGKIRGQGIFALNVDDGRGWSGFVQGQVYGGTGLTGYGGMAGIRFQWGS
jgi:autotransporter-like protein